MTATYAPAARAGITFYLVRAMFYYFTDDEAAAWTNLNKGLVMVEKCAERDVRRHRTGLPVE